MSQLKDSSSNVCDLFIWSFLVGFFVCFALFCFWVRYLSAWYSRVVIIQSREFCQVGLLTIEIKTLVRTPHIPHWRACIWFQTMASELPHADSRKQLWWFSVGSCSVWEHCIEVLVSALHSHIWPRAIVGVWEVNWCLWEYILSFSLSPSLPSSLHLFVPFSLPLPLFLCPSLLNNNNKFCLFCNYEGLGGLVCCFHF